MGGTAHPTLPRTRFRRCGIHVLVAAALVLAPSAVATWAMACVPQPAIVVQPRAYGPAGARVEVVGENFAPTAVEIRWNGVDAEMLAEATGPSFTTEIRVPHHPDGLYTLLAVVRGRQGEVLDTARTPFLVRPSGVTGRAPPEERTKPSPASATSPYAMLVGAGGAAVAAASIAGRRRRGRTRSSP